MYFIIFDLEFNQDFPSLRNSDKRRSEYPFEIIQIGAIKIDADFNTITTFKRNIKPTIYTNISPFVSELTGLTIEVLQGEETFSEVYKAFVEFIGDPSSIFCTWGISDMKELYKNAEYHKLDRNLIPKMYINLQSTVSKYLNLSTKRLLRLQHAVEALSIPTTYTFHNALYDAYYTAEIFKKVYNTSVEPRAYDPSHVVVKPRQPRRVIDFEKLLLQFEKMYAREMTEEEKGIIKLAYKMGRTNQFLK